MKAELICSALAVIVCTINLAFRSGWCIMAKKRILKGCPCCGGKAHWTKGNRDIRMEDRVQCLECFLEITGDYNPFSAFDKWDARVLEHYIQNREVNIDGDIK